MFASPKALAIPRRSTGRYMGAVPGMPHVFHRPRRPGRCCCPLDLAPAEQGQQVAGAEVQQAGSCCAGAAPREVRNWVGRRHPGGHGRPGSRLPDLIPLVDPQQEAGYCWRGSGRTQRSCPRAGLLLPSVHIHDKPRPAAQRLPSDLMGVQRVARSGDLSRSRAMINPPGISPAASTAIAGGTRPSAWRRYGSSPARRSGAVAGLHRRWMRAPWLPSPESGAAQARPRAAGP